MYKKSKVSVIASIGEDRGLGKDNQLLWHISEDLKRFKALTMGHPIIMGRKTHESIGKALPGRTNIVVSTSLWPQEGIVVTRDMAQALEKAAQSPGSEEIFIIGGGQIYQEALSQSGLFQTDKLYLTVINGQKQADVFFPNYQNQFKNVILEEKHPHSDPPYTYLILERQ